MTLTTVLFAGGLSRRMGVDKATLTVAGEQLWARQLRLLNGLLPDALWISARARPAWCPPEIEVVLDEAPSRGPLSGLAAALRRMSSSHLVALAVDLPSMTPLHLRKLRGLANPGQGIFARNGDYLEPLCAIYPVEAAELAANAVNSNNVSLQSFAESLLQQNLARVYPLEESEKPFYHNANSPADLLR
jgi:molybdopterin-guanine dinucleotide biosynthesis protein A